MRGMGVASKALVRVYWPAIIFLSALVARFLYFAEISAIPYFDNPISDGDVYWRWAGSIVGGDWLSRSQGVFYQAPLYPYFLALVRLVGGSGPPAAYVAQALINAFSCVIMYFAARRLFGRVAGAAAGLMLAFYPPAIFADGVAQKESLAIFFTVLLLWLAAAGLARPRARMWAAAGATLGLLSLTRENALLLIPLLALWIWIYFRGSAIRSRLVWSAALIAGAALALAPVGLRNLAVGGEFALTTAQLGPNLYIGNGPRADGAYVAIAPGRGHPDFERSDAARLAEKAMGRRLTPAEVSGYWTRKTVERVAATPGKWLLLMGRKALLTWNVYEVPDAEDFYTYRRSSIILRGLGAAWNFATLLGLALGGVVLTWRRRRELWVFYLLPLGFAAGVAVFYVFARYRLPLAPMLIVFAAAAVGEGARLARAGDWRRLARAAMAALLGICFALLPIYPRVLKEAGSYYNLGFMLNRLGRMDAAVDAYKEAIRLNPNLAEAQYNLGAIYQRRGDYAKALVLYLRATELRADYVEAWNNLGLVYWGMDAPRQAAEAFLAALRADPDHLNSRHNLENVIGESERAGDYELAGWTRVRLADVAASSRENRGE